MASDAKPMPRAEVALALIERNGASFVQWYAARRHVERCGDGCEFGGDDATVEGDRLAASEAFSALLRLRASPEPAAPSAEPLTAEERVFVVSRIGDYESLSRDPERAGNERFARMWGAVARTLRRGFMAQHACAPTSADATLTWALNVRAALDRADEARAALEAEKERVPHGGERTSLWQANEAANAAFLATVRSRSADATALSPEQT